MAEKSNPFHIRVVMPISMRINPRVREEEILTFEREAGKKFLEKMRKAGIEAEQCGKPKE